MTSSPSSLQVAGYLVRGIQPFYKGKSEKRKNKGRSQRGERRMKMDEEYCNLKSEECKKIGKLKRDSKGYICVNCGKRVSKWLPTADAISEIAQEERAGERRAK